MEMKDFTWITPDPSKVRRFIALPPRLNAGCDVWTEIYLGERLLIHKSYLPLMLTRGFMVSDKGQVYDTWQEAENAPNKYTNK